jgi:transcriptional regulator with GAF, ATPase, and Fis domain
VWLGHSSDTPIPPKNPARVDVRVVAATNRDLAEEVRAGRFRDDLYYRLNVFPIRVPPLHERLEDIAPLVARLAAKYSARLGRKIDRIDKKSLGLLESYDWPGNVRELENIVERAVVVSQHGTLHVERDFLGSQPRNGNVVEDLRDQERQAIESALRLSHGRVSGPDGAAKRLGVPASTLEFRIKRLGSTNLRFVERGTGTQEAQKAQNALCCDFFLGTSVFNLYCL